MHPVVTAPLGIDGISVYVPRLYVDLTDEWGRARASARGQDAGELVSKVTKGIGVKRMAIPDAHEDSATMAAMAAKRLIDGLGMDPRDVAYLAIGTETSVDQSKSMAAYVLGMLSRHYGVPLHAVGCPQFQFACIGATYAVEAAAALLRAGSLGERSAIVIATDVARYALGGPAECTQGAGAVALRISANPRLLSFEPADFLSVTFDERDFFRPNWCAEAVVDGQYSVDVYLHCLDQNLHAAVEAWTSSARALLDTDYVLFHTPFPRMAEYAAARYWRRLRALDENSGWPVIADPAVERELDRAAAVSADFRLWFESKCAPALRYAGEIGNIYSGAIYLSLATLVSHLSQQPTNAAGRRIALFYGSGASAKLFVGTIRSGYREAASPLRLSEELGSERRRPLCLRDYERLHGTSHANGLSSPCVDASVIPAEEEFALLRYGTESSPRKVDLGYRYYEFVNGTARG